MVDSQSSTGRWIPHSRLLVCQSSNVGSVEYKSFIGFAAASSGLLVLGGYYQQEQEEPPDARE